MSDETAGDDWLTRLSAEEWLEAATGELERATRALQQKQQRAGVTQARRAAGMAWNAVLHQIVDRGERARYGRSYVDHLRVMRDDLSVAAPIRDAAAALMGAPLDRGEALVQLGAGDTRLASAAGEILEEARRRVHGPALG